MYDINSVTKNYKILNKLFFLGTCLLVLGTLKIFRLNIDVLTSGYVRVYVFMVFSLLMFTGLIYTLFFAIPFKETYMEENKKRKACTEGMYALCRHPGVLWFCGMYLGIAAMIFRIEVLTQVLLYIIWNFTYIVLQDCLIFPKIFENYKEYQRETPFLVPNRRSICRALRKDEKGNR